MFKLTKKGKKMNNTIKNTMIKVSAAATKADQDNALTQVKKDTNKDGYHEYFHKDFPQVKLLIKDPPNFGIVFYALKKLTEIRRDLDPNHPFNKKD